MAFSVLLTQESSHYFNSKSPPSAPVIFPSAARFINFFIGSGAMHYTSLTIALSSAGGGTPATSPTVVWCTASRSEMHSLCLWRCTGNMRMRSLPLTNALPPRSTAGNSPPPPSGYHGTTPTPLLHTQAEAHLAASPTKIRQRGAHLGVHLVPVQDPPPSCSSTPAAMLALPASLPCRSISVVHCVTGCPTPADVLCLLFVCGGF
ncbi:hypothetical protein BRADI_4g09296v3 [Brachypodium distachyon]|uniref:Uncharacterized protein n=1 Tax=Brachypodium distachyon TaxID=15368 RepID=A0A2K2CLJ4_BRADI|nr:hypothetical protein BRADI_4g09296v3 [Brachypodium distachyon]